MKDIAEVLLLEAGLTLKPTKCRFAQDSVKFIGHKVGSGKKYPGDLKIKLDFPTSSTKTQIRSFLGITDYYSRYIKDYAIIAVPLSNILKGKVKMKKIEWNDDCEEAFQELKGRMTQSPVLYAPVNSQEFIVHTDSSLYVAGIVLSHIRERGEHPILYLSQKFSKAEQNSAY